MYQKIKNDLSNLPAPTVIDERSFDLLLAENIELLKKELGREYQPLESDPYMKKLRVLTMRQLLNNADKNETVKQLLVTTATGTDLDHIGIGRGVPRDKGEYPYTNFSFSISSVLDHNVVIPAGTVLGDETDQYRSITVEDAIIPIGERSVEVKAELQEYTKQSDIKTENIITDLPFITIVKQLNIFTNGSTAADDEKYRIQIIEGEARFSTAGAEDAYLYHSFRGDSRVDDVVVTDEQILEVHIYIASFTGVDDLMIKRVYDSCSPKDKRPLNDQVFVKEAPAIEVDITATIEIFDLLKASELESKIKANFEKSFFIGQDLTKSDFMRKAHLEGVYRVNTDFTEVITSKTQIIKIRNINLTFEGVK